MVPALVEYLVLEWEWTGLKRSKQTSFVVNKQSTFTYAPFHHHVWNFCCFCQGLGSGSFKSVICSTSDGLFHQEMLQNVLQPFEKKHSKSLAVGLSEKKIQK